ATEKVILYYTQIDGADDTLRALEVRDRFGVPSDAELIRLETMPLTCTGAIDREQLRRAARASDAARTPTPPHTDAERALADIWMRVLGVSTVSCDDNFFELGGDSLRAARLVAQIRETLGCEVPLRAVFDADNLSALAALISVGPTAAAAVEVATERPLSSGQRALWFLHQMAPASAAYNIAFTARIVSAVDTDALRRAFQMLVDRHDALRTAFLDARGEPVQRVLAAADVQFAVEDASQLSDEELQQRISREIKQPFDLAGGTLMRVRLFAASSGRNVLAVTFHHIVMDGWSLWVCLAELRELYRAARLDRNADLPATGSESELMARVESDLAARSARHVDYWKRLLETAPAVVALPTDRPRPRVSSYHGASQRFRLGRDVTDRLKAVARDSRSTPQMAMLALFQVLLHRYTA